MNDRPDRNSTTANWWHTPIVSPYQVILTLITWTFALNILLATVRALWQIT
jgi:hypothetical protein